MKRSKGNPASDKAAENRIQGVHLVRSHPIFRHLASQIRTAGSSVYFPNEYGWAVVQSNGLIFLHPRRVAEPEQWAHVVAHCFLHLGMEHFRHKEDPDLWQIACDIVAVGFLRVIKFGREIENVGPDWKAPSLDAENMYQRLRREGVADHFKNLGTAGKNERDMVFVAAKAVESSWSGSGKPVVWQKLFAEGLADAVTKAVSVAGGSIKSLTDETPKNSNVEMARNWFINKYPLLGAMAASFKIIENAEICEREDISIAAICPSLKEIYFNPHANLDLQEYIFVMAHEMLHAGLRHDQRVLGRDPFLWNCACDYLINQWLVEMNVGSMPKQGLLFDPELKNMSAEAIYDKIAVDLRRARKLRTFRGIGLGDMLDKRTPGWWLNGEGMTLDEFYRNCLAQGLEYHKAYGRGLIPGDLEEEINVLAQPAIPWDVELARWFDNHFPPIEKVRSFAQISRRQSSTPDIPRPRWVSDPNLSKDRTFGVVLDTSGSMSRHTLAKALGAIASYSMARDVPRVRLVFCDAYAYDQGYVDPATIMDRVKVRGRGGTILEPGIKILENAADFPKDGPILVITDGYCDRFSVNREHAFLMPAMARLPFVPHGPVFRIEGGEKGDGEQPGSKDN